MFRFNRFVSSLFLSSSVEVILVIILIFLTSWNTFSFIWFSFSLSLSLTKFGMFFSLLSFYSCCFCWSCNFFSLHPTFIGHCSFFSSYSTFSSWQSLLYNSISRCYACFCFIFFSSLASSFHRCAIIARRSFSECGCTFKTKYLKNCLKLGILLQNIMWLIP